MSYGPSPALRRAQDDNSSSLLSGGAESAAGGESAAATLERDIVAAAAGGGAIEQAPGLTIAFVFGAAGAVGIEVQHASGGGLDGNEVPEIVRNDVGDEKIYVALGVPMVEAAGLDEILSASVSAGALDLNAPKTLAELHQAIVRAAFAPGLGNGEAEQEGAGEEGGFGGLADGFGGGFCDRVCGFGLKVALEPGHRQKKRSRGCARNSFKLGGKGKRRGPERPAPLNYPSTFRISS